MTQKTNTQIKNSLDILGDKEAIIIYKDMYNNPRGENLAVSKEGLAKMKTLVREKLKNKRMTPDEYLAMMRERDAKERACWPGFTRFDRRRKKNRTQVPITRR